jgi:hypothetical protein
MEAIAHSPSFAKKAGVPQSVGQDFSKADKGKTFKRGGEMATKGVNPFAKFEKSGKDVEKKGMKEGSKADMALDKKQMMMKRGGTSSAYMKFSDKGSPVGMADTKTGKVVKKMATGGFVRAADGVASRGKTKATQIKMNKGGMSC